MDIAILCIFIVIIIIIIIIIIIYIVNNNKCTQGCRPTPHMGDRPTPPMLDIPTPPMNLNQQPPMNLNQQPWLQKANFENKHNPEHDTSGWVGHFRKGCHYCTLQKEELESLGLLNFVRWIEYSPKGDILEDHTDGAEAIPFSKLNAFPTWKNSLTGETKQGKQNICKLIPTLDACT